MQLHLTNHLYGKQVSRIKHVELHCLNDSSSDQPSAIFGRCCTAVLLYLQAFYHVHPESMQATIVTWPLHGLMFSHKIYMMQGTEDVPLVMGVGLSLHCCE